MTSCNLAIISPANNAYSETFIQQHRKLSNKLFFYYGGFFPNYLEGLGKIIHYGNNYFFYRLKRKIRLSNSLNFSEMSLANSFKKNQIELVLAEYGPTAVEVLTVCKKLKIPMVVHFHGFDASEEKTINKYKNGYKLVFNYASAVIVVSNQMKQIVEQDLGCSPQKVKLIPYGPADAFFEVIPNATRKQFLAVGRFVEKKAPHLTLAAFAIVLKSHPSARLIMVGDGELLPICKQLSKLWKIENSVTFTGVLSPKEVEVLFSSSNAFVQHSITASNGDSEGTPVAILEAGAASLPVISTKHAGISDVILNNETGFLVEELDVDAMAQKMIYVLENPDQAKQMGIKNKNNILNNYTLEKHLSQIKNIIDKILD